MRLELGSRQRDLRDGLRNMLRTKGSATQVRDVLTELDLFALEPSAGLALGLGYGVVACEELGRHGGDGGYRAVALASELVANTAGSVSAGSVSTGPIPDRSILLSDLVSGRHRVALADGVSTVRMDDGLLSGTCRVTGYTEETDLVVVPAGGTAFAVITPKAAGVGMFPGRMAPVLSLDNVSALRSVEDHTAARTSAYIRQAAYLLGLAASAHRLAVRRADTRNQFGRPLITNQAVAFPLAEQYAHLEALRLLVHRAAWQQDRSGAADLDATRALAYASELALEISAWAVHVHGAFGLTENAPVQRFYRLIAIEALGWGGPAVLWRAAAQETTERL